MTSWLAVLAYRLLLPAHAVALFQAEPAPRYLPSHFECAVFHEAVSGEVRGEAGRAVRQEHLGRNGMLVVRSAADSDSLEAWFDSLRVWREGAEGRMEPDTEGLLGGRWIGRLAASGRWTGEQRPFVPDEVGAVMDLAPLLDEFFPILPGRYLRVGGVDSSNGLVIRRERDAERAQRFTWKLRRTIDTLAPIDDTLEVAIRRETREEGTMVWSRDRGPLRWERTISTVVQPGAAGAAKARGTVMQRITVVRLPDRTDCPTG